MKKTYSSPHIKLGSMLLAFFLVLTCTSTSSAQKKKKWQIRPSLSFYEHYSDNLELSCDTCGDPVSGFKTQIIPMISALLPSKRKQIRIDFSMRMDHRTRSDDIVKVLYWMDLDTYIGHELSPRTSYEVVFGYDVTYTSLELGAPFVDAFGSLTRATSLEFAPGIRYRLGKKTLIKGSLSYSSVDYASEDGVGNTEMSLAGFIERKFGTRLNINLGLIYTAKTFTYSDGEVEVTETEIPIGIDLNLTYFKVSISPSIYNRTATGKDDGFGLGAGSQVLWKVGFDLGGKLFKLRKTTFKISISNDIHDDMFGYAYMSQAVKLKAFHVQKKADIYNEIKYGNNTYIDTENTATYYGVASSFKWYITKKKTLEGKLDYTTYTYEGDQNGEYTVMIGEIDYGYKIRDWLYIGTGIGRKQSSSDVNEGNYAENYFGFFAKADW